MVLSKRQQEDIDSIKYFIPPSMKETPINDQDIERFFAYSEHGKGEGSKFSMDGGYGALLQGKRWREWHMRSWEETVLEGTIPYYSLLGGCEGTRKWFNPMRLFKGDFYNIPIPRVVVDYMKKSMFAGHDAEIIERTYLTEISS